MHVLVPINAPIPEEYLTRMAKEYRMYTLWVEFSLGLEHFPAAFGDALESL